jgi:inosose dehydratase
VTALADRMAGAPITWGVDGSPGWGHLMPPERVLAEMADLGLRATELGPEGYLPVEPSELRRMVGRYGLRVVGGFVPAVLHRTDVADEQLAYVERASATLEGAGSSVAVLCADSDSPGYDVPPALDDADWAVLVENIKRASAIAEEHGLAPALHPHWGTAVCGGTDIERILGATDVGLCVDTGHLALAGLDPAAVVRPATERVRHVHLKDVDGDLARRVRSGDLAFRRAVVEGLFRPLGAGTVDVAGLVRELEGAGYEGWYVLEQDRALSESPPAGGGPVEDAARSVAYLRRLADEEVASG